MNRVKDVHTHLDESLNEIERLRAELAALRAENEQRRLWQEDAVRQCAKRGCESLFRRLEEERIRSENAEAERDALRADAAIGAILRRRLVSSNGVPVSRAHVTADEVATIDAAREAKP